MLLNLGKTLKYYKNAENRLLIFNYENTLKEIDESLVQESSISILSDPKKLKLLSPERRIITILKSLSDEHNMVFIISNYDIKLLQKIFEEVDNLGLCGENGFYYKYPSQK